MVMPPPIPPLAALDQKLHLDFAPEALHPLLGVPLAHVPDAQGPDRALLAAALFVDGREEGAD